MTPSEILAAITAVATMFGGFVFIFKYFTNRFDKSPAQQDADIDRQTAEDRQKAEKTGRPV